MLLGHIIDGLIHATTAEEVATSVAKPEVLARRTAAEASAVAAGVVIAAKVKQVIEQGGEDIWLDLQAHGGS